jgi:ribosomal protein S18 acetylase RimI-like enzyme
MKDPISHYVNGDGGRSCFWVAVEDGVVVGSVAVEPPQSGKDTASHNDESSPLSPDTGGREAELRRMSVASSHRGQGVAKLLFHELHKFAVANDFERIVLSTSSLQQAALNLYPKLGFTCVQKTPWPYPWLVLIRFNFFSMEIGCNTRVKAKDHSVLK